MNSCQQCGSTKITQRTQGSFFCKTCGANQRHTTKKNINSHDADYEDGFFKKDLERPSLERPRIPNFNSFATLIDRIIIENVKKTIFELQAKEIFQEDKEILLGKIETQIKIIKELKVCLINFMVKVWCTEDYRVISEERTFR